MRMVRNAAIVCCLLFLAGCAAKAQKELITKNAFIKRTENYDFASRITDKLPSLIFCFGGDNFELKNTLSSEFKNAIKETADTFPPYLNQVQVKAHAEEFSNLAIENFIIKRIDDFDVRGLTSAEQKQCEKLEQETAVFFSKARNK